MRLAAVERFAAAPLPTPSEEIWRYSRIDRLDLDAFAPAACVTEVDAPRQAASLIVDAEPELFADETPDVFAELNRAFMSPVVIRVPAGMIVEDPIVVTHHIAGDGVAVFPRLIIDAGADSEVTVVERFVAGDGAEHDRSLVVPVLQVRAAAGGAGEVPGHQRARHQHVADRQPAGGRGSRLLHAARHGRARRRLRPRAAPRPGCRARAASTRQVALYFADGTQMHDFRTMQDHDAPKTTSDLLFKGAVQDHAAQRLHRA